MTVSAFLLVCLFLLITQCIVTSRSFHAQAIRNRVASQVDPLSLLEGEDKIWADNMLLKAGIIEEAKPEPKHLVLDEQWLDTCNNLALPKKSRNVDSRQIDEFKAKVEAGSMVMIHERTQADKKLPVNHEMEDYINYIHGMMTEIYVHERREPVAYIN